MQLLQRPWPRPIYIHPLAEADVMYGFGFRHEVIYPDDTVGYAVTIESARQLAKDWEKAHAS